MFKSTSVLAVVALFLGTTTAIKEIDAASCASDVVLTGKYLKFWGKDRYIRCFADKGKWDIEIDAYGGMAAGNNEGRFEYVLDGADVAKGAYFLKEDMDESDYGTVRHIEIY